jgi:endonuclease/exonuclease/phosphatase family metal-dependent hydrolase
LGFRLVSPLDPQKFENRESLIQEIAVRALICVSALFTLLLCVVAPLPVLGSIAAVGAASKVLRVAGFALQKNGFTHVKGLLPETHLPDGKAKVMTLNVCGVGGGMSLNHGGVIGWRGRIDRLVDLIRRENPDVLVLEEIYDHAFSEELIARLKGDFAHFFTDLGASAMGSVGGCMVLTKCAVHNFSNTTFTNSTWQLKRGFAELEIKAKPDDALPCARIIGTHLIHGDEPEDKAGRVKQLAEIVNSVAQKTLAPHLPTILTGDLNIEREQAEGEQLSFYLRHGYQGNAPTCTNRLTAQWDRETKSVWAETIDYISLFKETLPDLRHLPVIDAGIHLQDCHLIDTYDETYNTKTALSDHKGVALTVSGLRAAVPA